MDEHERITRAEYMADLREQSARERKDEQARLTERLMSAPMPDVVKTWAADAEAIERERRMEIRRRHASERRQQREMQQAAAMPEQMHALWKELDEAMRGVGAVVEAIEHRLNQLEAKQRESTTVGTAVAAVEAGFSKIAAKLDLSDIGDTAKRRPHS